MYDPKFTQKQMYDQYGSSRETTKKADPKPSRSSGFGGMGSDPAEQFGGSPTRGIGAKPPSNTFGGGQDNNPNRDEYENKSTIDKVKEKAVDLFKSFGAKEPEALIVDGKRVYQGPLFSGYDPTVRIGPFGGDAGKKQYRFGMPILGEVSPSYPSPTLPPADNNPTLNMFGVRRGFTRGTDMPDLSVSPEAPANMQPLTRALAQGLIPTELDYTIKKGDTLSEIAKDRGTTVLELQQLNNIPDSMKDTIFAGDTIKVPVKKAKTYKDVDDNLYVSSGEITSDGFYDPEKQYYQSFTEDITPVEMLQTTGDDTYVSADYMSELEILARTIEAEAGGESKKGKLAVGAVIKNRADQNRFGTDIRSVILRPYQFSPWNTYTDSAGGEQGKDMLGGKMKPSKDAYDAAKKILSGDYVDPTFGASHFVNPRISKPDWYDGFKRNGTTKIGKHEFGDADNLLLSPKPKARPKGLGAK